MISTSKTATPQFGHSKHLCTALPPEALMERFGIDELAHELIIQGYLDDEADVRRAASKIILAVEEGSEGDQGIENAG